MATKDEWLPVSAPDLGELEERFLLDALRSSWISSTGPYVERFEREFAEFAGTRAAIAIANGTVALHLAMLAFGIGPGDEVIVPSLTYIATANAVRYVGAEPVFADIDPQTWGIDPAEVEKAVTPRTKGILPVHLYGHPVDMDSIQMVAERHDLWVVEDAAEAHGALYKGRRVGSLGSLATFSFYGNKILTSGEGGAITVDDPELERRVRLFRGQGMDPNRRYFFPVIGYNYRLTNLACSLLCAQLARFDELVQRRKELFANYVGALAAIPGIGFQPVADWAQPAPWIFCITIAEREFGMPRDELAGALAAEGIETRPFFHPIHTLPPYANPARPRSLPNTERLAASGLNLPTGAGLTHADVDRVASAIRKRSRN